MNRLQKKCALVSGGIHLLLLLILAVGPAFVSTKSEVVDMPILNFIPLKTTDAQVSNPGASASPPVRERTPTPVTPTPPTPPAAERKDETPPLETAKDQPRRIVPNLKPIVRNQTVTTQTTSTKPHTDDGAKENENRRRQLDSALSGIQNGLSSSTEIYSPGGGSGQSYANFLQSVKTIYADAWDVPSGVTDTSPIATVSVTIARDGSVVSSRITDPSGNALVDQSVQATLNRVRRTVPLPEDSKEMQRTVTIRFNVRAKLLG
jgi:TonB family protein